ncbi:MAG: DUF3343 domain-containing protein [Thermodesulfobacteriota bacterium]|jgi:hypothetical protein
MGDEQSPSYGVVLFYSVNGALLAEKLLKKKEIEYKLIPVPRHLSSDCGVCLRFLLENESQIKEALIGKVDIQLFSPL